MNKKLKAWLSVVCIATMVTSLAACSTKTKTNSAKVTDANKPVKVKLLTSDGSQPVPKGGFANSPEHKYILDKTGIDLDIEFIAHGQYNDLLKMKLAGDDLPDVFMDFGVGNTFVANGQATDLTEVINKFAPDMKKNMTEGTFKSVTMSGKLVGIPSAPWANTGSVMYLRKDWMDKLNLKVPTTSDELLNVLRAFRDGDPNKNGKKDEIPFTMRENASWGENVYGMWGVNSNSMRVVDGQLLPGVLIPNVKEGLGFYRTMYAEKLLDQEFLLNKRDQWTQKITAGLVGAWNHVPELGTDWQDKLNKAIPDEKPQVIAIPTPKGTGWTGERGFQISEAGSAWIVPKKSKNAEAVVKLANWLTTDEGYKFAALGIAGDTYTEEGANIKYDAEKDKANSWRPFTFKLLKFNEKVDGASMTKEMLALRRDIYAVSDKEGIPAPGPIGALKTSSAWNDLRGPKWAAIAAEIITGKKSVDEYDKWANEMKNGIAKPVVDELNQLYKASQEKK
jgi:putative aldouronate transport system substrate-binding protein